MKQLNGYLQSWLEAYDSRTHRGTGQTPKRRYEDCKESKCHLTAEELKEIFLWEETRTVRKTSVIEVEGNTYDVDSFLRGKKIKIRFNSYDLSYIQVWKDEERFPDAKPAELRNQSHSKVSQMGHEDTPETPVSSYLEQIKKQQDEEKRRELGTTRFASLKEKQTVGGVDHD
ncbi:Mu transposase C-terminal domain-containing protein [Aquibacillus sp. 3ASR75-11]|uniref:Mu transposase C-terminal domain-containing protein n=1 Tax=Terrihalobacillus insolitus TaxID=2950438 RepID=A0A9X3WW90_9BACI|nr:Mu transposase C-terminal domain-containing protein [Terrihalobacillus insolitus]MDC3413800.1 Mu transposase C-terminal domain-containing protein [Terrihalobacillus insolitus]MDC3425968.1 Mu transposase C-terminal domain-containing protein [Terrihalobacillus insolitus]